MDTIDYKKEAEKLQASAGTFAPWWNPDAGSYKVKILSEAVEYDRRLPGTNETQKAVRFDIEVDGNKYTWGMAKGTTYGSLYGQLVLLGKEKGKLAGEEISVLVVMRKRRDGRNIRQFTVLEAVDLIAEKINQGRPATLRDKLDRLKMRGFVGTKQEFMQKLEINSQKFDQLVNIGMVAKESEDSDKYVIV